jgi:hypothetical protein
MAPARPRTRGRIRSRFVQTPVPEMHYKMVTPQVRHPERSEGSPGCRTMPNSGDLSRRSR